NARCSTPLNQPWKREKSNGFCSRVSTTSTGRGVLSCVLPRSARTGMAGGGTGFALRNQSSGGGDQIPAPVHRHPVTPQLSQVGTHGVIHPALGEPGLASPLAACVCHCSGAAPGSRAPGFQDQGSNVGAIDCSARPILSVSCAGVSHQAE